MDEFKKDIRDVEENIKLMLQDLENKYDIAINDIDLIHDVLLNYTHKKVVGVKIDFDI